MTRMLRTLLSLQFVCEIAVDSAKVLEALVSAVKADDSATRFGNVLRSAFSLQMDSAD